MNIFKHSYQWLRIPSGTYCYNYQRYEPPSVECPNGVYKIKRCPFWCIDTTHPEAVQENGYCKHLGQSDWDINHTPTSFTITRRQGDGTFVETQYDNSTMLEEMGMGVSLLWDSVKECGHKNFRLAEFIKYELPEIFKSKKQNK